MTKPIYAIGDIHGQLAMLDTALDHIEKDGGAEATVVFLGDYTDRGPDSRGVLDRLIQGQAAGKDWVFIKGNHDRMFEWFLQTPSRRDDFLLIDLSWVDARLGGDTTLASYGIDMSIRWRYIDLHAAALDAVPADHIAFLRGLQLTHETPDLFFAHAGIRPGLALDGQDEEDLLWIRQEFHDHPNPHPKLVVHGHTPIKTALHYGNRVNLDTGAGYGKALTVGVFDGGRVFTLDAPGRTPLLPTT